MPLTSKSNRRPAWPLYLAGLTLLTLLLLAILIKYTGGKPGQYLGESAGAKDTKNYEPPTGASLPPESAPLANNRAASPASERLDPFTAFLETHANGQSSPAAVQPVTQNLQGPIHDPFKEAIEARKNQKPVRPLSPFGTANPAQ